jgi:hypothetical protein
VWHSLVGSHRTASTQHSGQPKRTEEVGRLLAAHDSASKQPTRHLVTAVFGLASERGRPNGEMAMKFRVCLIVMTCIVLAGCANPAATASPLTPAALSPARSATPTLMTSATASSPVASAFASPNPSRDWPSLTSAAFETPGAAPGTAWASLSWQDIAETSPLRTITHVVSWRGGYVAMGDRGVWTSTDGLRWSPVGRALPAKAAIVAETRAGLVALAYDPNDPRCAGDASCRPEQFDLPIEAWTSADGTTWQDRGVAAISSDRVFSVVGTPLGALAYVADSQGIFHVLVSADGVGWHAATGCENTRFAAASYLSGRLVTFCSGTPLADWDIPTVARWSGDGTSWSLGTVPPKSQEFHSAMGRIVAGRSGLVATGGPSAGSEEWWLSSDGSHWALDSTYGPLATTPPGGMGNFPAANGDLESDGLRMIAVSWGNDPGQLYGHRVALDGRLWASWDGRSWSSLASNGQPLWAHPAVVFPRGVLTGASWGTSA